MRNCTVNINEKDYNLCLVRNSAKWLENRGVTLKDIEERPVTFIDEMWASLFVANYPDMTMNECIDLLEQYKVENGDINEIMKFGIEEYNAFLNALNGTKSKKKKAKITKA